MKNNLKDKEGRVEQCIRQIDARQMQCEKREDIHAIHAEKAKVQLFDASQFTSAFTFSDLEKKSNHFKEKKVEVSTSGY